MQADGHLAYLIYEMKINMLLKLDADVCLRQSVS